MAGKWRLARHGRLKRLATASVICLLPLPNAYAHGDKENRPQLETVYDCRETQMTNGVALEADVDHVGWQEVVDGIRIQAYYNFLTDAEKSAFLDHGFSNSHYGHPVIFFEYPKELKPDEHNGYTIMGRPLSEYASGARVGQRTFQQRPASNVLLSLNWPELRSLLEGEGDIFVSLYDVSGKAYKTIELSRQHFQIIESALQRSFARVNERERDQKRLCEAKTVEIFSDIIVVD